MRYRFKVKVNIKNQKVMSAFFDTAHGDADSFPDAVHEQDLADNLSEILQESIKPSDLFIISMNLIEDRGETIRKKGKLENIHFHDLDS